MNIGKWLGFLLALSAIALVAGCSSGDDNGETTDGDASSDGDEAVDGDEDAAESEEEVVVHRDEILGEQVDETYLIDTLGADTAVIWDEHGIPHIYANSMRDAAVAMGYVQASMRIVQMDFFRKVGRGRLTELLVSAPPALIDFDLYQRAIFSMANGESVLEAIWNSLDEDSKDLMYAFCEGVNARLERYRADDSDWPDPFDFPLIMQSPAQTPDWEPLDIIGIARYQTWDLSNDYESDIDRSILYDLLGEELYNELIFAEPAKSVSIAPHEGSERMKPRAATTPAGRSGQALLKPAMAAKKQLEEVRRILPGDQRGNSNNWVMGRNPDGFSYLANDPHLSLYSPSIFLPVTMDVREMSGVATDLHTGGVAFPGTPAIVIGRNGDLAWGETVVGYDVKDVYLETVTFDGDGNPVSVLYNGSQVPVIAVTHELQIGHRSDPSTETGTLYFVPHHGPILPGSIDREEGTAISLKWTGHEATREILTFIKLEEAKNLDEAFTAIEEFGVGAQNFVVADRTGEIGWYPHARVPLRSGDLAVNPPWRMLPGEGGVEWTGYVPKEELPKLRNPEEGFIITANNDPTGATLDNDVLNDGHYWMFDPADGWRAYTAKEGLKALKAAGTWGWPDMAMIQTGYRTDYGEEMVGIVLDLVEEYGLEGSLTAEAAQGLSLLRAWNFEALSGIADYTNAENSALSSNAAEVQAAAATTFLHHLMIRLAHDVIGDELSAVGVTGLPSEHRTKPFVRILRRLHADPNGIPPEIFDDIETDAKETPADILLGALDATAADIFLHSAFDGVPLDQAVWGRIHRLILQHPMSSITELYNQGPFGLGGDPFTVNVASFGPRLDPNNQGYDFYGGPSLRIIHELSDNGIATHFTIPGGVDEREGSDHFLDLFDLWAKREYTDLNISLADVKTGGIEKVTALVPHP